MHGPRLYLALSVTGGEQTRLRRIEVALSRGDMIYQDYHFPFAKKLSSVRAKRKGWKKRTWAFLPERLAVAQEEYGRTSRLNRKTNSGFSTVIHLYCNA